MKASTNNLKTKRSPPPKRLSLPVQVALTFTVAAKGARVAPREMLTLFERKMR